MLVRRSAPNYNIVHVREGNVEAEIFKPFCFGVSEYCPSSYAAVFSNSPRPSVSRLHCSYYRRRRQSVSLFFSDIILQRYDCNTKYSQDRMDAPPSGESQCASNSVHNPEQSSLRRTFSLGRSHVSGIWNLSFCVHTTFSCVKWRREYVIVFLCGCVCR